MKYRTAIEIRNAIEAGEITALEVVEYYLAKIKVEDKAINAFLETFDESALESARKIDAMKKAGEALPRLAGVPVAIKDNMTIKGEISSCSSKILENHRASYDATVVKRLKVAGAIIIGRTNCVEFAMGSSNETSFWGAVHNPWNLKKVPGGSSGGSAAAVSAGFVPIALGSDTGGSIRQPAALCGITGMKPTYGRVSRYGLIALASSLDQIGPIAHTAQDCALVLEVIEGIDEKDSTSLELDEKVVPELIEKNFKGMTFGVPREYFIDGMDEEVRKSVEEAIELIKQNGGEIKKISLPLTDYALAAYYIIQPAEASSNLARFDGIRYGTRAQTDNLWKSYLHARGDGFGAETKRRIMLGTYILSAGYYDAYYKKALAVKTEIFNDFKKAFEQVDVIVCPTSPAVAWDIGEKFNDPIAMYLADIFTVSANIAGIPGISVPCGENNGLPIGLQFLGASMQDGKILRAASAYQSLTDWHQKDPK